MKHEVHSTLRSILACAALLGAAAAHAATYYVDVNYDGANGPSDGSETKPWTRLGDAVPAFTASSGHTVKVAGGIYKATAGGGLETFGTTGYDLNPANVRDRIGAWRGGYVGHVSGATFDWSEETRVFPTPAVDTTGMTVIDLTGANSRAFYASSSEHTFTFDGFRFQNSNVSQGAYDGGALYNNGGYEPSVMYNCVFLNNRTTGEGGGAWFRGRYGVSTNCLFVGNAAGGSGGGAVITGDNGYHTLEDSVFDGNVATGYCGGLYVPSHTLNLNRVDFTDNVATFDGGGLGTYNGSGNGNNTAVIAKRCRFVGNSASRGAAVGSSHYKGPAYTLENCLLAGNTATHATSGYVVYSTGSDSGGDVTLQHTTIADNMAPGGGVYTDRGSSRTATLSVQNCILVGDGTGIGLRGDPDSTVIVDYNIVRNFSTLYGGSASAGANDSSADPQFADIAVGDYRLAFGSPCVDAGTNLAVTVDLDGIPRPTRHGFDIGAYEEWQIPIIASRAAVAQPEEAEVRAEFTYESAAIATHAFFVIDTADQGTNSLAAWWQSAGVGEKSQGGIFGAAFSGLSPSTTYFYRCMASNSYDVMWGPVASFKTPAAGGATRVWTGLGGDALASNTNNWLGGLAPGAADYVLLDASSSNMTWDAAAAQTVARWTQTENYRGTVTFETVYGSSGFTVFTVSGDAVVAGGTWTHPVNPASDTQSVWLNVVVVGDFTLGAQGTVDLDNKGFPPSCGPGRFVANRAASHGGQGGASGTTLHGTTYGSVREPVTLGSGGQTTAGGGAFVATVDGTARIDGTITAIGGYRTTGSVIAGAGGTIQIAASAFEGSGTLDAFAGLAVNTHGGSIGSGGGRIALLASEGVGFGTIVTRAHGGWNAQQGCQGAAGTVYLEDSTQTPWQGTLIVDNNNIHSLYGSMVDHPATVLPTVANGETQAIALHAFERIVLRNNGLLVPGADSTVDLASVACEGGGTLELRSASGVTLNQGLTVSGYTLSVGVPLTVPGNLTITADGVLTHPLNYNTDTWALDLEVTGDMTVATGGSLSAMMRGYCPLTGPGAGNRNAPSQGGSHGGLGGLRSTELPTAKHIAYGSVRSPAASGSGAKDARGGGVVKLAVNGTLTIDGSITAMGHSTNGEGGGAGGSLDIAAAAIAGSGVISVAGASTTSNSGFAIAGGGGRAALRVPGGVIGVSVASEGGTVSGIAGDRHGAAGTVYAEVGPEKVLTISNPAARNVGPLVSTLLNDSMDDLSAVRVELRAAGRLRLTGDLYVADLLIVDSATLQTDGHTLYVNAMEHHLDDPSKRGTGDTSMVDDYANIVWTGVPTTTVLIVR